jgi:hypothetical protein
VLGYMSLPDSAPQRHAADIPGIRLWDSCGSGQGGCYCADSRLANLRHVIKDGELLTDCESVSFSRRILLHEVV